MRRRATACDGDDDLWQSWPAMIGPAMIAEEFTYSLKLSLAALEVPITQYDPELSRMSHRRISNALHVNGRLLPEQRLFDFKLKTASPDTEYVKVLDGWFLECRRNFFNPRNSCNAYKDFIDRTCQWVGVVNSTHILQCARRQDCIGYHGLSVNENLCFIDGVEKVVGWSPLMWNRQSPYPSYNPPPFHLLSTHLTIHA